MGTAEAEGDGMTMTTGGAGAGVVAEAARGGEVLAVLMAAPAGYYVSYPYWGKGCEW